VHQIRFSAWALSRTLPGELTALLRLPSWVKGDRLLRERGGKGVRVMMVVLPAWRKKERNAESNSALLSSTVQAGRPASVKSDLVITLSFALLVMLASTKL